MVMLSVEVHRFKNNKKDGQFKLQFLFKNNEKENYLLLF
jgi:hypothetical protein